MTENTINTIFYWCVQSLERWAYDFGITYEAINVWLFCIIIPSILLVQFTFNIYLILKLFRLYKRPPKRLATEGL